MLPRDNSRTSRDTCQGLLPMTLAACSYTEGENSTHACLFHMGVLYRYRFLILGQRLALGLGRPDEGDQTERKDERQRGRRLAEGVADIMLRKLVT